MSSNVIPVTGAPGFEPEHPGTILRDEFLVPHRLEVSAASDRLGVTRQTVHRILAGTSAVTADMALRLGKLTGTTPAFWLNLQATHDGGVRHRGGQRALLKRPQRRYGATLSRMTASSSSVSGTIPRKVPHSRSGVLRPPKAASEP